MLGSATLAAWGTRGGRSTPFRAEGWAAVPPTVCQVTSGRDPLCVSAPGRGLFPVSSGYSSQRKACIGAGGKAGLRCRVDRDSLNRDQAGDVITFHELSTKFGGLQTAGA